eukprot:gnl/Trimastix_PCT/4545.p1 GENE.gnl/Trimastix_PCT/4545~~gnl/Trimastix_PCT/4545.p1  ORF type:complete len:159 (-),score=53.07 gnl/Trimastix_PCT/4545:91-567(-)
MHQLGVKHDTKEEELAAFFETILTLMQRHDIESVLPSRREAYQRSLREVTACGGAFLSHLRGGSFSCHVISALYGIKSLLLQQHYVQAEERYFELSIGNAPWPTAQGRKLTIFTDEHRRRTLQTLKRLMTFWKETVFPRFVSHGDQEERLRMRTDPSL